MENLLTLPVRANFKIIALITLLCSSGFCMAQKPTETASTFNQEKLLAGMCLYPDSLQKTMLYCLETPKAYDAWQQQVTGLIKTSRKWWKNQPKEERNQLQLVLSAPEILSALLEETPPAEGQWYRYFEQSSQTSLAILDEFDEPDSVLKRCETLLDQTWTNWNRSIKDQPKSFQPHAKRLSRHPELLQIMLSNPEAMDALRSYHSENPEAVQQKLDSMNLAYLRLSAFAMDYWKSALLQQPAVRETLIEISNEYAGSERYTSAELQVKPSDQQQATALPGLLQSLFGLPIQSREPYWKKTGFYLSEQGSIVGVTVPSVQFMQWYLKAPDHHQYFPACTKFLLELSKQQREYPSAFQTVSKDWMAKYIPEADKDQTSDQEVNRLRWVGEYLAQNSKAQEMPNLSDIKSYLRKKESEQKGAPKPPTPPVSALPPGNPYTGNTGPAQLASSTKASIFHIALILHQHCWSVSR